MHNFKVLVVGNAKCGKSSFIRRFARDSFDPTYKTTIGADFVQKEIRWKAPSAKERANACKTTTALGRAAGAKTGAAEAG